VVGLHREGELVGVVAQSEGGGEAAEGPVFPDREGAPAGISLPELERLTAVRVPPAHLGRQGEDVGRGEAVLGVRGVDSRDAWDIRRDGDVVVGDPHRGPDRSFPACSRTEDLEEPGLLGVDDGQALPGVDVAVLLGQRAHHQDGLAGGAGAGHDDLLQLLDGEDALLRAQLPPAADGRLAHRQLVLVHAGIDRVDELVGLGHLGNLTERFESPRVADELGPLDLLVPDGDHLSRLVSAVGHHLDPGPAPSVARVRGDRGAVRGGQARGHDAGASVRSGGRVLLSGRSRERSGRVDEPERGEDREQGHGAGTAGRVGIRHDGTPPRWDPWRNGPSHVRYDSLPPRKCEGDPRRSPHHNPIALHHTLPTPSQIARFTRLTTNPSLHQSPTSTYPAAKRTGAGPVP